MNNQEVAKRMYDYIVRINNLMDRLSKVLNNQSNKLEIEFIKEEYKDLKQSIKEDAHYISLSKNKIRDESILQTRFCWAVQEASAWGVKSSTNSKVDRKMWRSLEEARYKLTKSTSEEKWKELSENNN